MKLTDFIICDDIRHEEQNKKTIVGIYNDKIIFSSKSPQGIKWPVQFPLAVFFRILFESKDEEFSEIRISFNPDIIKQTIILKVGTVDLGAPLTVASNKMNFLIEGPGPLKPTIKFTYDTDKQDHELCPELKTSVTVS